MIGLSEKLLHRFVEHVTKQKNENNRIRSEEYLTLED